MSLQAIEEKRKRELELFYQRVIHRADCNDAEINVSDIPIFLTLNEISDVSRSKKGINMNLVKFVEDELNSKLKKYLIQRSSSKLLETEDYQHWHNKVKTAIKELETYLSISEIKYYLCYCYHHYDKIEIANFIDIHIKNNLQKLFTEKELARNDTEELSKIQKALLCEWTRLKDKVSLEYCLCYALEIFKTI